MRENSRVARRPGRTGGFSRGPGVVRVDGGIAVTGGTRRQRCQVRSCTSRSRRTTRSGVRSSGALCSGGSSRRTPARSRPHDADWRGAGRGDHEHGAGQARYAAVSEVDDIKAGAARVTELGGEAGEPMPVPAMGWSRPGQGPARELLRALADRHIGPSPDAADRCSRKVRPACYGSGLTLCHEHWAWPCARSRRRKVADQATPPAKTKRS